MARQLSHRVCREEPAPGLAMGWMVCRARCCAGTHSGERVGGHGCTQGRHAGGVGYTVGCRCPFFVMSLFSGDDSQDPLYGPRPTSFMSSRTHPPILIPLALVFLSQVPEPQN